MANCTAPTEMNDVPFNPIEASLFASLSQKAAAGQGSSPLPRFLSPAGFDWRGGFPISPPNRWASGFPAYRFSSLVQDRNADGNHFERCTAAAADFLQLLMATRSHRHPGTDRVAIGFCPNELDQNPISVLAIVLQQARRIVAVVDQKLHRAVIIEIGCCDAVAVQRLGDPRTGIERNIFEPAIVPVPIEQFALAEGVVQFVSIQLRIDMPIRHEEVRPSVVVHVYEKGSPAHEECD